MTDTTMTQAEGEAYLASFGASPGDVAAYYAEPRTDHDAQIPPEHAVTGASGRVTLPA